MKVAVQLDFSEIFANSEEVCDLVDNMATSVAEAYAIIRFTQLIYEDAMLSSGVTPRSLADLDDFIKKLLASSCEAHSEA